jgi:hypothetical protein
MEFGFSIKGEAVLNESPQAYFDEKIVNIRANLDAENAPSADLSSSAPKTFLSVFEPVLPTEICEIVDECPAKSSFADPIPTNILKKIIHVLARPFASLINLSFCFCPFIFV